MLWNMLVLLYKLFQYFTKCKAARLQAPGVKGLNLDTDYEQTGTRYVQTNGDYELIERGDVKMVRDSNQDNVKFFDSDLDRQMKTNMYSTMTNNKVLSGNNLMTSTKNVVQK